jgi:hypothetical protein
MKLLLIPSLQLFSTKKIAMDDIASFNVHHDWMSPLKCKAQMPLYPKKKKKKEAQMPLTQKASMIHH